MGVPHFGLIVVGDEILSGKRSDRHFAAVVDLLKARDLSLAWAQFLPDERQAIASVLRNSFASRDVVFCCGGIGATPDDHTRQAAAQALSVELRLHPEAARLIALRCAELAAEGRGTADMTTPENLQRLKMGEFPDGASIIPNSYNRIPGFSVAQHWFVPGFPAMAWPMLEWVLDTRYREHFNSIDFFERSMLVFDTPESAIASLMEEIEERFNEVKLFSLPSMGDGKDGRPARRHIELGVKGPTAAVKRAFDTLTAEVSRMGAPFELP